MSRFGQNAWYSAVIAVRTARPDVSGSEWQGRRRKIDKDLAVTRVQNMDEVATDSIAQPPFAPSW
ncbi:MAG: hypothetical protein ACR2NN_18265 [Bryobacteraceae bacterium]